MKQEHKKPKQLAPTEGTKSRKQSFGLVSRGLDLMKGDPDRVSEIMATRVVQLIVGPYEFDLPDQRLIEHTLQKEGFSVRVVGVDELLQTNPSRLSEVLNPNAELTAVLSGIRWSRMAERVPSRLLPNPIVFTSNPGIPMSPGNKPAIIMQWANPFPTTEFLSAVRYLEGGRRRLPRKGATFEHERFGWVRRPAVTDQKAIQAWETLHQRVRTGPKIADPGEVVRAWAFREGYLGWKFEIRQVDEDQILVRSAGILGFPNVPKEDFCMLAEGWEAYRTEGTVPDELASRMTSYDRAKVRSPSERSAFHSDGATYLSYMASILHWLDEQGEV